MADLNVQPKRNNNWWIWLLLAAIAIALIIFLSKGCGDQNTQNTTTDSTASTSSEPASTATTTPTEGTGLQGDIDFNSPAADYEEIVSEHITVRSSGNYAIYSLGDNILFDVDKSTIRADAEPQLKQIAASLGKRYASGKVMIYGHTDSTGDAAHNKELAEQRAEAVKSWIIKNGKVKEGNISIVPLGESQPVATNATESGKQQNRSVQIVAKNP